MKKNALAMGIADQFNPRMLRVIFLVALFGTLYGFQLGQVGLFDYDEGCYAAVSKAMHEADEWIAPSLNGEPFFEKPPMLYWAQRVGYLLFGVDEFGVRIFNALAALALTLCVFGFSRRPLGPRAAFYAALALGVSLEFFGLARVAFTDMFLALWLFLCLAAFHRARCAWHDGHAGTGWFMATCVFSGLAILTKGLIGVILPVAAALFVCGRAGQLRSFFRPARFTVGTVVLLGVGLSWYLAVGYSRGFSFMQELFIEHHVGRFTAPMQGHEGPFFFYVPILLFGFLPWSPFLVTALTPSRVRGWADDRGAYLQLFATFGAITFVFFSMAATKLPNYLAPVFLPAALLIGDLFACETPTGRRSWFVARGIAAACLALVGIAMLAIPFVVDRLPEWLGDKALKKPGLSTPFDPGIGPFVCGGALLVAAGAAWQLLERRAATGLVTIALAISVFQLATIALLVPRYHDHFATPLRETAEQAAALVPEREPVVLLGLRHLPSVVFYGGQPTRYVSRKRPDAIAALFDGPLPTVGITATGYVDRIRGPGRLEIVSDRNGWILFRCWPRAADEPREPSPSRAASATARP